ncbi:MAG: HNH endonuclease signature motif containing protein, partial [Nocardioides sp.]
PMIETDRMGAPVVVEDLDADWLLALAEDAEVQSRRAELRKLRYAAHWCVLNPATADTGVATWAESGSGALGCDEAIGGDGTPQVAAFAAEQLGAAYQVSTAAAVQLMADVLNLQHRHPRIWAKVEALDVPAWRARRVARACAALSRPAALHVDKALVGRIASVGMTTIDRAVADALATYDPESVPDEEQQAQASWGVRLTHASPSAPGGWAGTSTLEVVGDTADLTAFHDLICGAAEQLRRDGSDEPLEMRKARAVGVLAGAATGGEAGGVPVRTRLYLHVDATDLDDPGATGAAERLGPATVAKIRSWLAGSRATIVPVLDLARADAVDRHDPPAWMRELVVLRDRHCVFPWCERDSRACDLDHVVPYRDPDEGGPPGQTSPDALAPLCRRHHRCKTSGRWRYRREPDGTYTWTSPLGRRYAVRPLGTLALSPTPQDSATVSTTAAGSIGP